MDYRDLVIADLADENACLRGQLMTLADLAADLAMADWCHHREFARVLRFADEARLLAQRQRDDVLDRYQLGAAA